MDDGREEIRINSESMLSYASELQNIISSFSNVNEKVLQAYSCIDDMYQGKAQQEFQEYCCSLANRIQQLTQLYEAAESYVLEVYQECNGIDQKLAAWILQQYQ